MSDVVWDIETYKNVFTLAAEHVEYPLTWCFEISPWRDDSVEIVNWVHWLRSKNMRMIGFNNLGFDYPVLHMLLKMGRCPAQMLYDKAQAIIGSQETNRWEHMVYPSDRFIEQIDLMKIHHFDNKARMTSLKALEFNMRMDDVSDLPFPVGSMLTREQVPVLKTYNAHDVRATKRFYQASKEMIEFREELTREHGRDFMNHNDVKIGKEIFQMELEKIGVPLYKYGPSGREPMQTKRASIALKDCIPSFVEFHNPEFQRIKDWMAQQVITETKGVFEDVSAKVGGLEFVFGTGGIHASVSNKVFEANDDWMILDVDVAGMYPSIAVSQGYYPEHLGPRFVDVYKYIITERGKYKKGTTKNAAYKLAGNGTYGASNDKFSVFFDPLFTMKITIGGQLMLALLVERLLNVDGLSICQSNTDGTTMYLRRDDLHDVEGICKDWEKLTGLVLEYAEYKRMAIADVNSYIAVGTDGKVKRKGRYEHKLEWHKNHSALVIAKIAEKVIVEGADPMTLLMNWPDKMDFMLRVKVPRSSRLIGIQDGQEIELQNTTRYYAAKGGVQLVKIMPPLAKKPGVWRRIGVESGWTVCVCNDLRDATLPINYDYYRREIDKLILELK